MPYKCSNQPLPLCQGLGLDRVRFSAQDGNGWYRPIGMCCEKLRPGGGYVLQQSLPVQAVPQQGLQQGLYGVAGMQQYAIQQPGVQQLQQFAVQPGLQQFAVQPGMQQFALQQPGVQQLLQPGMQQYLQPAMMQQSVAMQQPLMQQQTLLQQPVGLQALMLSAAEGS